MDCDSPEHAQRIRSGDTAAFRDVFLAHYASLCAVANRYVQSADVAEDLVQGVFVSIWVRRAEWNAPAGARAYLYAAVRNRALNHLRDEAAQLVRGHAPDEVTARSTPDGDLDEREFSVAVAAAVAALPDRCRQVFLLQREGGLTYAQIASDLGISVKTVETHMGRALSGLRSALAHYRG